jgi:acetolactate synthase-1/3 small subunit
MTLHTLIILVEDHPGALSRISGLFSRRGYNIESLAVGRCERAGMSRITITLTGDDSQVEQVRKQAGKLIDVIKVSDITMTERVERELALIRVTAGPGTQRAEIMQIAQTFQAGIVDMGNTSVLLEVTGDTGKIDAIERLLRRYGVRECTRTGRIAARREGPD